jgi:hypothetical protein
MRSLPRGRRRTAILGRPSFIPALVTFLILGTLTTLWALASPLMSVPDEPAHAIKAAAVARGQLSAETGGKQGDPAVVRVPAYFAELGLQTCTAFKPDLTAACAPQVDPANRAAATAATTAGNYNPFYYLLVGLPSRLLSGAPALYAMRIASGLMSAVFMTMAFVAATRLRRSEWPVAASVVALTPMVLFLSGSINPNSLEIVTTAAFFLNLCVVLDNFKSLAAVRAPILAVGISGAVLANTRALSLIWLAAAFVAALIIFGWRPLVAVLRDKLGIAMVALTGLGCAAGLAWLVLADSFKSLGGTPSTTTPDQAFAMMLDRTFDYANGYVGVMGWLDTPSPQGVQIFWHFAVAALLLGGLACRPVRARWAVLLVLAAIVFLPPILQSQVVEELGYIWQGRYLLALVVLLVTICGVALRSYSFRASPTAKSLGRWVLGGTVAAHLYVFVFALRRFTVGLVPDHTNWTEMWEPMWQPPLTWQVLAALYLVALSVGALLVFRHLFGQSTTIDVTDASARRSPGPAAEDAAAQRLLPVGDPATALALHR